MQGEYEMKRKSIVRVVLYILLAVLVCFGPTACGGEVERILYDPVGGDYSIVDVKGKQYLVFDDISIYGDGELSPDAHYAPAVRFSSVEEFRETLIQGRLTPLQKHIASMFPKDEKGRIKICDLNDLYTAVVPQGSTVYEVMWYGDTYYFSVDCGSGGWGDLDLHTKESFEQSYMDNYVNIFKNERLTITKTEYIDGGQKEVIFYNTPRGKFKGVRYSLSDGEKKSFVYERYMLSHIKEFEDMGVYPSSTVPYNVEIFVSDAENYYDIVLFHPDKPPTDSWILQFGLEKYVKK